MLKKYFLLAVAVLLMGSFTYADAQAGWFGKKDEPKSSGKSYRYDYFPSMSYQVGTLRRDNYSGWSLDGLTIHFRKDTKVTEEGLEGAQLREGRKALIMGAKVGDSIIAWRVRIMEPDWSSRGNRDSDPNVTWSASDPTVGEGPAGPQ